jgi:hypothetical protein
MDWLQFHHKVLPLGWFCGVPAPIPEWPETSRFVREGGQWFYVDGDVAGE